MPALQLFGRRWNVASDDFVIPALVGCVIRLAWLIGAGLIYRHIEKTGCRLDWDIDTFFISSFTVYGIAFLLNVLIARASGKGSVLDFRLRSRHHIEKLLACRAVLILAELAVLGFGIHASWSRDLDNCEPDTSSSRIWLRVIVISVIVLTIVFLIWLALMFDIAGNQHALWRFDQSYISHWERRCKLLCCCASVGDHKHTIYADVAPILARFFKRLDVVPSDIAAAMVIMQAADLEHNAQARHGKHRPYKRHPGGSTTTPSRDTSSASAMDTSNTSSSMQEPLTGVMDHPHAKGRSAHITPELLRSTGSYGSTSHSDSITTDSSSKRATSTPTSTTSTTTTTTTTSSSSSSGDKAKTELNLQVAAYFVKYAEAAYGWPLYIFAHPCTAWCGLGCCSCLWCHRKAAGVDMHGDNCVGCNYTAVKAQVLGPDTQILHTNYKNRLFQTPYFVALDHSAKAVVIAVRGTLSLQDCLLDALAEDIEFSVPGVEGVSYAHKGIVQAAQYVHDSIMKNDTLLSKMIQHINDKNEPYRLVVVGHSLGAGTAALLSILLHRRFQDLICFSYSPPGGLVSPNVSKFCRSFILSVVVGNDMIPRTSMRSLEEVRNQMVQTLAYSRCPKWTILLRGTCWGATVRRLIHGTHSAPSEEAVAIADRYADSIRDDPPHQHMVMAGRVLYLENDYDVRRWCATREWSVHLSEPQAFQHFTILPRMMWDHFPDYVSATLRRVAAQHVSGGTGGLGKGERGTTRVRDSNGFAHVSPAASSQGEDSTRTSEES